MATLWSVPRSWEGETCAVLASGPSMTREQADFVRGKCRVVAVSNQAIDNVVGGEVVPAFAPWADVLYATDEAWWLKYAPAALNFAGLKVTVGELEDGVPNVLPEFDKVLMLQRGGVRGLDTRQTHIRTGGNSGYAAVHLAISFGARRIILLGFDMRGSHWFGRHPAGLGQPVAFTRWMNRFKELAPLAKARGIEILNCTPRSALDCFARYRLEEALA